MKKLRKTLAVVLAVMLLISVIPFASVAEGTTGGAFTVSRLNGAAYDGVTPIRSGDTLEVDVMVSRQSNQNVYGWYFGYSYDESALTCTDIEEEEYWRLGTGTGSDFKIIGGSFKVAEYDISEITGLTFKVATIYFTVNESFTGAVEIGTNKGGSLYNYFSILNTDTNKVDSIEITAEGTSFTVYENTNKTALEAALADAASRQEATYTPNSWEAFVPAYESAQAVFADDITTQAAVNEATDALTAAIAALTVRAVKTELNSAVNAARKEANKTSVYTPESIADLNAVLTEARTVQYDDNADQDTVNAMTASVIAAKEALVKKTFTVIFQDAEGNAFDTQTVRYGENATVPATNPTKAPDETYTYTFKGWVGKYTNITKDTNITPDFDQEYIEYTIVFQNEDGTVLKSETLHWGDEVLAPEEIPTKAADETNTYTFKGWDKEIVAVAGDATYTATYDAEGIGYIIVFQNEDGTVLKSETLGWGAEVTEPEEIPTKAADETNTYTFKGWDKEIVPVAGDAVYTATYNAEAIGYTIVFKNEDGTVLKSETLGWGAEVTAPEETPVKLADDTYTYTFTGWDKEVVAVAGDATYTATYTPEYIDYTIVFKNEDGTVLKTATLHWGDEVTAPEETPIKAADETYTYTFNGWDKDIVAVAGDATYTATYTHEYIDYTIVFKNEDGTVLKTATLHWGDEVTAPEENPTKESTVQYNYTFAGWDKEVVAVAGDATYTAVFTEALNKYPVTFKNADGSVFTTVEYEYGSLPTNPEGTPEKASDDLHYYTFEGWTPEYAEVVGAAEYTATFEEHYKDADYKAVNAAVDAAVALESSEYTEVSYARVFNAMTAVVPNLKINEQDRVTGFANAINEAIAALVSENAYQAEYAKCAAINNNANTYTVESFEEFAAAFAALGAMQDFNTEEATQAQVNAAYDALVEVQTKLVLTTLQLEGYKEAISENEIVTASNITTAAMNANDGGAGLAELKFYDAQGNVFESTTRKLGTGFKIDVVQLGQVMFSRYVVIYGDINGDGQVSIADIMLARKLAVSQDGFTEYQILAAKCGGDEIDVNRVIELAMAL